MHVQHVVHLAVTSLLLLVISTDSSESIHLREDSSEVLDTSDGNLGSSEHGRSIAGITDTETETNINEQSSSELSVLQKQVFSSGNETFPSVDKVASVLNVTNLQGSSEVNNAAEANSSASPINRSEVIMKTEGNNEFLQPTSNDSFGSFPKSEDNSKLTPNHTVEDNASFLNSNPSYSFATDYVTPQQYGAEVYVDSDSSGIMIQNNYSNSLSAEDTFEQSFDENSFKQLSTDASDQDQIADQSDSNMKQNTCVNLENCNISQIQSQEVNGSVDDVLLNQEQLDSPAAEFLNNSFDTEEIFEKVFNISVDDTIDNEQMHNVNYQADSEQHAKESPGSNIQVSGSHTEQNLSDNQNTMLDNIFEVYHYSREPDPDGAKQNKSLAQHIEELVLSRLPSSYNNKDSDQEESRDHEENNIPLGVEISPDEIGESDDEEMHSGASLAFVFDSTGSMWDDLVQVKVGAERIMATMLELPDKPIYNYVLVPFHDPSK
jgi:hypothetical protein